MSKYRGVVTLDDDPVPVTVGLHDDGISLVAGDVSIGEWQTGEYVVIDLGSGDFVIEADEGSISFHPDDPGGFARGIGQEDESEPTENHRAASRRADPVEIRESPPPRPATLAAFYVLAGLTAALGTWALIAIF
jgi:hypothetical protein